MKKYTRYLLIVISLCLLALGFIYIRSYYLFIKQPLASLTHAVPENTIAILKAANVADFVRTTRASGLSNVLDNPELSMRFETFASWSDSLIVRDEELRHIIENREFLIGFSPDSLGNPCYLLAFSVGKIKPGTLQKHVTAFAETASYNVTHYDSKPETIFQLKKENQLLWFYFYRGIFALSDSKTLLESSLQSIDSEKPLTDQPSFARLLETTGKKVDAALFIKTGALADVLFNKKSGLSPANTWATVDLSIRKDHLMLNGFTFLASDVNGLAGQQAVVPEIPPLPENPAIIYGFSLSDPLAYSRNFVQKDTLHVKGFDAINQINTHEVFDLSENLGSWMGTTLLKVIPDMRKPDASMTLVVSRNADSARNALRPFLSGGENGISRLIDQRIPGLLLGKGFGLKAPVYCLIRNQVVAFSSSLTMLSNYSTLLVNDSLGNRKNPVRETLISGQVKGNFFAFINPGKAFSSKNKTANEWNKAIVKCNELVVQISAGDPLLYTHGKLLFEPSVDEKEEIVEVLPVKDSMAGPTPEETLNEVALPVMISAAIFRPVIISGKTAREKRVAILSDKNLLTIFDDSGKPEWSFRMKGKPTGDVYTADFQKNGKQQYLVFTHEVLHVLDANGREVKGSPVNLPGEVSGNVAVFDYDRRRDYRAIYQGSDGLIYNITLSGTTLPDWQKPRTAELSLKAEFIRTSGKDYLFFTDEHGKLLITDRRGRERISIFGEFRKSNRANVFENLTNSKGLFITASDDGRLVYITAQGVISYSSFGSFGKNPWFAYGDFDGDGSQDFAFAGVHKVGVYTRMKKAILEVNDPKASFGEPFIYKSSLDRSWLTVRDKNNGKVYVLNSNGKSIPLKGLTSETDPIIFNPGGNKNILLVTTNSGKVKYTPLK